ncbi:MAG: tyrosine-type recombinase/integrase [Candidatus Aenigmatarchaeota archaeon]
MSEEKRDIHNFDRKLASIEKTIRNDKNILDSNRNHIKKFLEYCHADEQKLSTIHKDMYSIWFIAKNIKKDFKECTKEDIIKVLGIIQKQKWSDKTKRNHKVAIKKLWRIIYDIDEKGIYPEAVRWLKTSRKNADKKLPEEIITESDIVKLLESCGSVRDRLFISLLYETGARIGEILNIKIKHVVFDQEKKTYYLMLNGKTGMRRIPIISSVPLLTQQLNSHPMSTESSLFLMRRSSGGNSTIPPLTYSAARKLLFDIRKKTDIKKPVNPHAFRHAAATRAARLGMSEQQMKMYFGWTGGSDMPAIYCHLSCRDLDGAVKKMFGIKDDEEITSQLGPRTCKRCQDINEPTSKFCKMCGSPLDLKIALELEQKVEKSRMVEDQFDDDVRSQMKELKNKFDKFLKGQGKS